MMNRTRVNNTFQKRNTSESGKVARNEKGKKSENKYNTRHKIQAPEMPSFQQPNSSAQSNLEQSVIVMDTSSDLNIDGLEPSVLKCVKHVLANSEGQHSFVIVNQDKDNEPSQGQTTYIIDMDSLTKQTDSSKKGPYRTNQKMVTSASSQLASASPVTSLVSLVNKPTTASTQHSKPGKDVAHVLSSPASVHFQDPVEISFVSCPSQMDLNNPSSEAEVSIEIMCSEMDSLPARQPSQITDTNKSVRVTRRVTAAKNLSRSNLSSNPLPLLSQTPHVSASSSSSPPTPPALHKSEASTVREPAQKESHVTAEYLLHMAKKIVEDRSQNRKPVPSHQSRDTSTAASGVETENCSPEPVITMYLSSSSGLKEIINTLNINSPVVTQTNDDLSVDDKEAKENSSASSDSSCHDYKPSKPVEIHADTRNSSDKFTDSLVATLAPINTTGVLYRCVECGYCSHNKHYYKQHVDLVHNDDRPYKCPHCDYAGKRRHALLEHLVVHSNQRPFTCDHCNASFRKKGHLTNHIKLHTSQRLVHCGVCNIQLPDAESFEAHLRKIHNTDKLYKCRLCDHTVVDKEMMLKHLHEHNEVVMYSCPKCPSLFGDEENLLRHMKGNHHFSFIPKPAEKASDVGVKTSVVESVNLPQPTSIICSECGFVCKDTEMMQKHMWLHIKQETKNNIQGNDKTKTSPIIKEENCSNLGVLKMNVDLGQKTLPKDVVYQCSSCSYTSSDNSAFIKHMLAHKTQEKKQNADSSGLPKFVNEDNQALDTQPATSAQPTPKPVSYYSSSRSDTQVKTDSGVPFIYDKASARFRCVICGYHCEFQRTIKAHIWKHSGHQNIEYPTFDHISSTKSNGGSPVVQILANKELLKPADGMSVTSTNSVVSTASDLPLSQNLPVLRTRSGDTVQLVPVNPLKTNYSSGNLIQIKNNSIIIPAECGETSAASRFLESIAFSDECTRGLHLKDRVVVQPSSTGPITVDVGDQTKEENPVGLSNAVINSTGHHHLSMGHHTGQIKMASKLDICEQDDTRSSCDVDERCTEPSVVVEVMDTICSETGLTGLKSQQGSPRIPDFDASAVETKLSRSFATAGDRRSSYDSEASLSEDENIELDRIGTKTVQFKSVDPSKDHHSYSTRLRCPTCDCLLMEDFRTHLLSCQKKSKDDKDDAQTSELERTFKSEKKCDVSPDGLDEADNPQTEDTDSVESCDEVTNSGSSTGQQKSGICSSLLAVIEQLRERSRSESEEDKQIPPAAKKGNKKKMRQDNEMDLISIEDLQNIEKISENGGEKFRCSLCHYSSYRICNIKLHMKTHRQKKPSECSLCDFSSSSPEALQEHMLKHCKVRTYPCKFCPQSFNHKSTLRAHLRAHKDQEPFLCAYCVFETTSPMEYREHMQVHSGCSSRLRCPGCDLILSNKEELTVHLLMCKGSTRASRALMDPDDRSEFNIDKEYDNMEQNFPLDAASIHHACVVPGCAFSSSSLKELQDHLSVHCNPSLLVCNLCDFKALHSRSLKSHMKRHANDQRYVQQPLEQYKCNLCGYVCHHLPSLKSHMWRHASDQSYSYEFTNDVINAAIDHDTRVDADGDADDPELLDRVINSERKILEGELTKFSRGDGQRPICWVTFRCCSCGFETINKAKLNIHMRSHSDIIQKALDFPRKSANFQNKAVVNPQLSAKSKRSNIETNVPDVPQKVMKKD